MHSNAGLEAMRHWPLHRFFSARAAATGALPALEIPAGKGRPQPQALTYAELDAASDHLARHLAARIDGEAIFALCLPRTTPLLAIAQLAVLKAGAAFTCIDPAFPAERIREIIEDAEPVAVLADETGLALLAPLALPAALLCDPAALLDATPPVTELPADIPADRLAYVIYTSGTTGKPKGVMIEHGAIANLVAGDLDEFGLGPGDRVIQGSSAAYDSSIEESWLALASGATLVVMDDAAARLGPDVVDWLRATGATVFCPPPTLLRSSGCADPAQALPDIRLLYVGGEALPTDIAELWGRGRRLVNGYGPTECAVTCVRGDVVPGRDITIGQPVPGMAAYVLDDALDEVAEGAQGELCMAGLGLARGYRNRADLTDEKFVDHPRFGRIYRTGDLVHRDAAGDYHYHGRIDAQVKLRGYRIELGEIEARLAGLAGVRSAGCRLQDIGTRTELVGYVVPADPADPPAPEALRAALGTVLPAYMVPRQLGLIADLPTTVSGKLDRAALPELAIEGPSDEGEIVSPDGPVEAAIARATADILKRPAGVSVAADFFEELGGDSLSAAMLVTLLRESEHADWVTVSDIYEARTIRELAKRATRFTPTELAHEPFDRLGEANVALANLVQGGWLALLLLLGSWGGWLLAFRLLPALIGNLGLIGFVLLMPLLTAVLAGLWVPLSVALAVAIKQLTVGQYRELRAPVWSPWYLRHWLAVQAARLIPWPLLAGTGIQISVLRALGAKIGEGVHIARGVDLRRGGWDLLEIGDDVSLGVDAYIGLVELDRGDAVVRPVRLANGVTLETRAGVCGGAAMEAGSHLAALSVLNRRQVAGPGELWDGVPAQKVGAAPPTPVLSPGAKPISRARHDLILMLAEGSLALIVALPGELLTLGACLAAHVGVAEVWRWVWHPTITGRVAALVLGLTMATIPVTLVWSAVLMRLIGRVPAGTIPRWSTAHIRAWIKAGMLRRAGEWLSGTIFWPRWLRLAGMNIGPKCEISTIIDVVPELVSIGAETFFADGIYLGAGHAVRGTVTLGHTRLGRNNFLGNHAVVPQGEVLPDNVLFGISTLAEGAKVPGGGARFGHPSFALPRREVVEADRSLTHEPSAIRYINRMLWELARFALPIVPLLLTAAWYSVLANWDGVGGAAFAFVVLPLASLIPPLGLCLGVLVLKWALIGRVKPGQHALWSCWCSRWDFVYVAWAKWANLVLQRLEGTFILPAFLRLMGLKLGKRVVLGPEFAQVVDPDMIEIGDYATAAPMFQAHTFEDRVLKVDYVKIGAGATVRHGTVPLYGAVVGEHAHVGPHSVIMKQEHLLPYTAYQGVPTRVFGRED